MKRSIHQLQKQIHEYKKRRSEICDRHGYNTSQYISIKEKITSRKNSLKRGLSIKETIDSAIFQVSEFIGYTPTGGNVGSNKEKHLSKAILYKYLIEKGVKSSEIAQFLNMKDRHSPARNRRNFTRSFRTNKENLEMWRRFKSFMKDYKDDDNKGNS